MFKNKQTKVMVVPPSNVFSLLNEIPALILRKLYQAMAGGVGGGAGWGLEFSSGRIVRMLREQNYIFTINMY